MSIEGHDSDAGGPEADVSGIDPRFVVLLRGKSYPVFAGVLDAVTRAGMKSLTTTIIQIPSPENGQLAVVMARLEMEDGRIFEDVGDCSPQSATPALASAALRFASTRAKGRVCRDAANCGAELLEEAAVGSAEQPHRATGNGQAAVRPAQQATREAAPAGEVPICLYPDCAATLTKNEVTASQHHFKTNFCREHLLQMQKERAAAQG